MKIVLKCARDDVQRILRAAKALTLTPRDSLLADEDGNVTLTLPQKEILWLYQGAHPDAVVALCTDWLTLYETVTGR